MFPKGLQAFNIIRFAHLLKQSRWQSTRDVEFIMYSPIQNL